MADGTQMYNLPPQVAPAVNALMNGGTVPQVAPGPRSTYNLPAAPDPYRPLTAPAGLPVVPNPAIPQAQIWHPDLSQMSQPQQQQPMDMPPPGMQSPTQQDDNQDPMLGDAWKTYASGITDHAPTRDDFNKFSQWYQTRYVDPHLVGLKGVKPTQLKAYQNEFQQRAQDLGDTLFPQQAADQSSIRKFAGSAATGAGGALEKMLGGLVAAGGGLMHAVAGGDTGNDLMAQANTDIRKGLAPTGENMNQWVQRMMGHNYGNPQLANQQRGWEQAFQNAYGGDSSLAGEGQNRIDQASQGGLANRAGATTGEVGGNIAPVAAATLLSGGADLPVLATAGGASLAGSSNNAMQQLQQGQNLSNVRNQAALDAGLGTLMQAIPVHTPGANVLKRVVQSAATNAGMATGQQVADQLVNPDNKFDWDNVGVQALVGGLLGLIPNKGRNPLKKPAETPPAAAPAAATPAGAVTPPAAPGAPAAAPQAAASPADHYTAAVNTNADANGVSANAHASAMQTLNNDLNASGKTTFTKTIVRNSTDPASLVENAVSAVRRFIPDDTWNTFSASQRQDAISEAAAFLAKKSGVDPQQVTDTLQQFQNPQQTTAALAASQPTAQSPAPAAAPAGVQETPLPADISGTQVPGTQAQSPLSTLTNGTVTGQHPEVEAQHLYNVASGIAQDDALAGSKLGQAVTRLVQNGNIKTPADVQTVLEKLSGSGAGTPQQPVVAQARNALKTKTNAQQAEDHAQVAETVTNALADASTPEAAKNKLKGRVRQNAEQKFNEQFMQAALNHGVSSGSAEDAIRADPHFMAIRQAIGDGRITTPEQLGSFLKNERDIAETANQQVATPVETPKGLKNKKGATPSPKSEAPVANTGAAATDLEGQLRERFADSLPQHAIDQMHDAIANAKMGDGRDLGDLLQGWKESGDITKEDAQWIRQQAKTTPTAKASKPLKRSLKSEVEEARANEDEPNDDYFNDEYHQNNASGESSASLEAQNRLRDEREAGQTRAIIRRDGSVEPLRGVDAVDTHARPGEVVVQRGIGKDEWTVLSHGNDLSRDVAAGKINRARADLDKVHAAVSPQREVDVPGFGKYKFDQTHDVELLGGSSNDGKTVYADKDWNPVSELRMLDGSTKLVDRSPFLAVHELEERRLEKLGGDYTDSHHAAQRKEDAAVRAAGIDPKSYQESFDHEVAAAAKKTDGKPPKDIVEKPYEHPHSERARKALENVQDHEDFGPHGEYTLHMDDLEELADQRNKTYAGTEKEVDRIAPLQTKRRVSEILNNVREGADVKETGAELQRLHDDMEDHRMQRRMKEAFRQPKRGVEYVRQRLQEMIANHEPGDDHYEAGKFGQWLLEKNPNLANYLAVRIHDMGENGAAGKFNPAQRMFHINSKATNPGTAVHEIMHSAEQLMPPELQNKIRGEYIGRLQNKIKQVQKNGNDVAARYLELAMQNYVHPSVEAQKEMSLLMRTQQEKIPYDEFYKYSNPSEYWAVEATDMLNNRYLNNGWADKIKDWLGGFFQHVKSLLGLDSNHQISRGLDSILQSPGVDYNDRMLANAGRSRQAADELHDEQNQSIDEDEQVTQTKPVRASKKAAKEEADRASAATRGPLSLGNYLVEQLAKATVGVEKANEGLRRSGVEINSDNDVDNAIYRSRGLASQYNRTDSFDTLRPFTNYVHKNYQRFGGTLKEALTNINDFFENTHWQERIRQSWMEEAPMKTATAEAKRAALLDDVESGKVTPEAGRKQLEDMTGDLKYGWEQWGRNHNQPIQEMQRRLGELKTKFGIDESSMADLNKIMDVARKRQTERLTAAGQVAADDPWTKFYNFKWWVPLKSSPIGDERNNVFDLLPNRNNNLSQLNQTIQAMHGRSDFAELPVARLFVDTARAGRMHAQSHVGDALYNLATDPKAAKALGATIDTWNGTPHDGYTNAETGQQVARLTPKIGKDVIQHVVHDGRDHYVISLPGDSQMGRGLVAGENIAKPGAVGQKVSKVTNVLSRLYTTFSPAWMTTVAFPRDLVYVPAVGAMTEHSNPIDAIPFFAKYTSNAMKAIGAMRYLHGALANNPRAMEELAAKDPDSWAAWTQRYMQLGGNNEFAGGMNSSDLNRLMSSMNLDSMQMTPDGVKDITKLGYNALSHLSSRYADFLTQIPRVAYFRTRVEQGVEPRLAAAEARKVLDYAQSGVQGRRINAFKAFFRVSATGVDAMRRAFVKPEGGYDYAKLAKWAAFYSAVGAVRYMISNALLGQDENGKDNIAKYRPDTIAARTLIPMGDNVYGWQSGLGLPQMMTAPGALMAAVGSGHATPEEAAKAYVGILQRNTGMDSEASRESTPLGFVGGLIKAFTPTVAAPLVDLHDNMNQYGTSIYNEPKKGQFASDSGRASTPTVFKDIARSLNSATSGGVDISPEEIAFITREYGGQFASTLMSQLDNKSLTKPSGMGVPGLVHDQDFYQQREVEDTLDKLSIATKRYNAIVQYAKENGSTDQQAEAQGNQMLLQNPELRTQRQLFQQLNSAVSARAAAMKALQQNKFMSQQGKQLQMKQIDSRLRQTLDNVQSKMQ